MDFEVKSNFNEVKSRWDVEIKGEIDIYNSEDLKKQLGNLIEERPIDLYMGCSDLEYIDSTGLGALVSVLKRVRQYSGSIYLRNLKQKVLKTFKITDLDKVFILEGDADEQ